MGADGALVAGTEGALVVGTDGALAGGEALVGGAGGAPVVGAWELGTEEGACDGRAAEGAPCEAGDESVVEVAVGALGAFSVEAVAVTVESATAALDASSCFCAAASTATFLVTVSVVVSPGTISLKIALTSAADVATVALSAPTSYGLAAAALRRSSSSRSHASVAEGRTALSGAT